MPSNACFDDPNQQGQVTVGNGYYKFDLNFSDAGVARVVGNYTILKCHRRTGST